MKHAPGSPTRWEGRGEMDWTLDETWNGFDKYIAGLRDAIRDHGGESGEAESYAFQLKAFLDRAWPESKDAT